MSRLCAFFRVEQKMDAWCKDVQYNSYGYGITHSDSWKSWTSATLLDSSWLDEFMWLRVISLPNWGSTSISVDLQCIIRCYFTLDMQVRFPGFVANALIYSWSTHYGCVNNRYIMWRREIQLILHKYGKNALIHENLELLLSHRGHNAIVF